MTDTPVPTVPDAVSNHPAVVAAKTKMAEAIATAQSDHAQVMKAKLSDAQAVAVADVKAAMAKLAPVEAEVASVIVKTERRLVKWIKRHTLDAALIAGIAVLTAVTIFLVR